MIASVFQLNFALISTLRQVSGTALGRPVTMTQM